MPTDRGERLNSWKEIAVYLNRSVRTVIRWEDEQGLPVHRQLHDKRGAVHAYKAELDEWIQRRTIGPESVAPTPSAPARPKRRWIVWGSLGAILATTALACLVAFRPSFPPPPRTRPLTTYSGNEMYPALSPDGDRVVFAWDHEEPDKFDLYKKQVGSDAPLVRLTARPAEQVYPAWSPDGLRIAFARQIDAARFELAWTPARGGPERHIAEILTYFMPRITWTPDSKWIVAPHRQAPEERAEMYLIAADGGEMRRLRTGVAGLTDRLASFSPDGRWLALAHQPVFTFESIQLIPVTRDWQAAGPPTPVDSAMWCCLSQLAWSSDSKQLLYSKIWENSISVWQRDVSGGAPHPVISAGQLGSGGVAFSARRSRLAYSDYRSGPRIWRLDLGAGRPNHPRRYLSSEGYERSPTISPDGMRVAFTSSRMGPGEIWTCDADGTNERPTPGVVNSGAPRWSPDGKQIAFDAVVDGKEDVYVVRVAEGQRRRITSDAGEAILPTWSADGNSIYFSSPVKGRGQVIWKTRADGKGEPVKVTDGWMAQEAPDGHALFVAKSDQAHPPVGIWKKPLPDGPETLLIRSLNNIRNFAVTGDGIYYEEHRGARSFAIAFYRFSDGRTEVIEEIGRTPFEGLALAPGADWLLFSTMEEHPGDLWLVDNFR